MELRQIEAYLDSPNLQERMKAITELRYYTPEVVVPLLRRRMSDKEFIENLGLKTPIADTISRRRGTWLM